MKKIIKFILKNIIAILSLFFIIFSFKSMGLDLESRMYCLVSGYLMLSIFYVDSIIKIKSKKTKCYFIDENIKIKEYLCKHISDFNNYNHIQNEIDDKLIKQIKLLKEELNDLKEKIEEKDNE